MKTLQVRVKDKHAAHLRKMARDVNFVWNYLNELSSRAIRERGLFLSAYDLEKYIRGCSPYFTISHNVAAQVCSEYAVRRRQFKKARLSWRKSGGARRSLGWVPFRKGNLSHHESGVKFYGRVYQVWDSYGLDQYEFRNGSFSEDARGRWYLNITVVVPEQKSTGAGSVGVDLGLKDCATDSNGGQLHTREFRALEEKLAVAQRANKPKRVRAIHAKIKNRRKDAQHKYSRKLVNENAAIFVGNVSPSKLVKTRMAKSVHDVSWCTLKTMLEYKCDHAGVVFEEVNEAYSTVTCSACNSRTGPTGLEGLRIREWTCGCGVTHDRDVNAAKNILALGHERLAVGSSI